LTYGYGLAFASLASICWGIAPVLNKRALVEMGFWKVNAFRAFGLIAILLPVFIFADAKTTEELLSLDASTYLSLALVALLSNMVGDVFYFVAIRCIGVSLAAPITSLYPLAVAMISWVWFGEVITFSILIGTLAIVAGLALLNVHMAETRGDGRSRNLRGLVSAFLTALCWAVGLSLNKHLTLNGVSPIAITFWRGVFFCVMAIAFLPLLTRGEKETPRPSAAAALAAASAGVIALVVGGWFYVNSLLIIPISVATPIASSSPLAAAVFACAFLGESLRPTQWLGIVFVVAGAVAVSA
jgi:drug/metabolite transporter (DMT)-like permease